jgi:hypothetical protein
MADETAARKQARDKTGDDLETKRLDDLKIALIDLPKLDNIAKALSQELKKLGDDVDKYHDDVAKGKKMSVSAGLRRSHSCRDFGASGSIFQAQAQSRARERTPVAVARARTGGKRAAGEVT